MSIKHTNRTIFILTKIQLFDFIIKQQTNKKINKTNRTDISKVKKQTKKIHILFFVYISQVLFFIMVFFFLFCFKYTKLKVIYFYVFNCSNQ